MQVRFWGTRGSLAKPGPSTLRFGGNTACVEVRASDGTLLIIDCGTGIQNLGQTLMTTAREPLRGNILISHTHWDHIQGFPFFTPLFVKANQWSVFGPRGLGQSLRDALSGQMEYTYFPITLELLGSSISFHDLVEGTFKIGDVTVRTRYLNHPALTLGYRIEADGVALVYASDHEPYLREAAGGVRFGEQDARHVEFLRGADLVIHDAQYRLAEYDTKIGWGHSTVEYAVGICRAAEVRRLALTHHDPQRSDDEVEQIERDMRSSLAGSNSGLEVFAAAEGPTIDLSGDAPSASPNEVGAFSAVTSVAPAIWQHSILIGATSGETVRQLSDAAKSEGIPAQVAEKADDFSHLMKTTRPSLVILDQEFGQLVAAEFPSADDLSVKDDVTIVAVAHSETPHLEFVTDWLIEPFSEQYLRTRMRAWVLRNACRWERAQLPQNEDRRLAELRKLRILDTEDEERFDRITRLAAALFDAPIALVTLVDEDRRWFKSCHGYDVR